MDMSILGFYSKTTSTFFAIIGPIDLAVLFAILTAQNTHTEQRHIAVKSGFVAFCILVFFACFGSWLIQSIGISISAIKISGGLLLIKLAYDMLFGSVSSSNTPENNKQDISVFPLGTPMLAGAGAISVTVVYTAESPTFSHQTLITILAFTSVILLSVFLFIIAGRLRKIINPNFMDALTRIMGILLMALAVQFILDGLQQAGVF